MYNTPVVPNITVKKKVAVGLSGGVDSSVSAYLLKEAGYDVTGVHMVCWDSKMPGCTADKDRADAVAIASQLNIPFEALDFVEAYRTKVIDYFYSEYKKGRTPNPDVMCNKEIKFGLFLEWAMAHGFDYVATGHYARILRSPSGSSKLLKGIDPTKDQSYFLYLMDQNKLSKTLFPVGDMPKKSVREIAQKAGLVTAKKPDSVGICFIGEVNIKDFLKERIQSVPGNVVDIAGEVIGSHEGVWFYTIGQRHGFTVSKYVGLPLYVIGKNVEKNELIVGIARDVKRSAFDVSGLHWINDSVKDEFTCDVRVRHLGDLYKATFTLVSKDTATVKVSNPIFGVAPGQSAVFYDGDELLGGGIIN